MSDLKSKLENFLRAVKRLNEVNVLFKKNRHDEVYQDSIIMRFAFSFELAWKTLREFLSDQGFILENNSPKGVLSYAFREGYIDDEKLWLDMLQDRNSLAHEYDQEQAAEIAERISTRYCKALLALQKTVSK